MDALSRSFLPTWFCLTCIVAVQMLTLIVLPEQPEVRVMAWGWTASVQVAVCVVTTVGVWAFPKIRAGVWLIGAMCSTLLGLLHGAGGPTVPPEETFLFFCVAAILLAVGAWERARVLT